MKHIELQAVRVVNINTSILVQAQWGEDTFTRAKDGNLPMLLEQFRHKGPLGVIELAGWNS
jgi:hypothetical protein